MSETDVTDPLAPPVVADAIEGPTAADADAPEAPDAAEDDPPAAAAPAKRKKPPKSKRPQYILFTIVALLSLAADQGSKIWARTSLGETSPTEQGGYLVRNQPRDPAYTGSGACEIPDDIVPRPIPSDPQGRDWAPCSSIPRKFISDNWEWSLSMNRGSAFGFLGGQNGARVVLSIVGILAVFGMLWMLRKARTDQKVLHWALALVAGGAVGNLVDRIYFGVVTDFVSWRTHLFDLPPWPTFNVADVVLVAGVILMFIDIRKEGQRDKRRRAKRQAKAKQAGLVADLATPE